MTNINLLSIVVSVYNEEEVLEMFWTELEKYLMEIGISYELIFVNDGSNDNSKDLLVDLCKHNNHIKVINFSKNFGHEAAMIAGIDYSRGDAVICMDADLQHPPAKLREMIEKYIEGYEVINMVRKDSENTTLFRKITSYLFYYILNLLSIVRFEPNASDFFLISRRVANIIRDNFLERTRFLRGFIQVVGFKRATIQYDSTKRASGQSKYSLYKLILLSAHAVVTFSNVPLRLGIFLGVVVGLLSFVVGLYSIVMKLMGYVIPGYTTIVVLLSFLLAIQFFILGIIGGYIGVIFNEIKKRPIYIVENEINFTRDDS